MALVRLGGLMVDGAVGVPADPGTGCTLMQQAAEAGDREAKTAVGSPSRAAREATSATRMESRFATLAR